jgi:hypothetical protein
MQTQAVKAIGQTLAAMQKVQKQPQPQLQVQMPRCQEIGVPSS